MSTSYVTNLSYEQNDIGLPSTGDVVGNWVNERQYNQVTISESLEKYIIELVFATRDPKEYGLDEEAQYIQFGASPRASINLNLAAKANAFFDERDYVLPEDVKEIANDVMNHRILLNYEAEADGITTQDIIKAILGKIQISK